MKWIIKSQNIFGFDFSSMFYKGFILIYLYLTYNPKCNISNIELEVNN